MPAPASSHRSSRGVLWAGLGLIMAGALWGRAPALSYPVDPEELALTGWGLPELAVNPPLPGLIFQQFGAPLDVVAAGRWLSLLASLAAVGAVGWAARRAGGTLVSCWAATSLLALVPSAVQQSTMCRSYGAVMGLLGLHMVWVAAASPRRGVTAGLLPLFHYATLPLSCIEAWWLWREGHRRHAGMAMGGVGLALACVAVSGGSTPQAAPWSETWFALTSLQWQGVMAPDTSAWSVALQVGLLGVIGVHALYLRPPGPSAPVVRTALVVLAGLLLVGLVGRVRHPVQSIGLVPVAVLVGALPASRLGRAAHSAFVVAALSGALGIGGRPQPSRDQVRIQRLAQVQLPGPGDVVLEPDAAWTMWAAHTGARLPVGRGGTHHCEGLDTPCYEALGRRWLTARDVDRASWFLAPEGDAVPASCAVAQRASGWTLARCR